MTRVATFLLTLLLFTNVLPGQVGVIVTTRPSDSETEQGFATTNVPALSGFARSRNVPFTAKNLAHGEKTSASWTPQISRTVAPSRGFAVWPWDDEAIQSWMRDLSQIDRSIEGSSSTGPVLEVGAFRTRIDLRFPPTITGPMPAVASEEISREGTAAALAAFKSIRAAGPEDALAPKWGIAIDFHTYVEKDGTFSVIPRMHSPVLDARSIFEKAPDVVVHGAFEDRSKLIGEAATQIEAALLQVLANRELGGGFSFTPQEQFEDRREKVDGINGPVSVSGWELDTSNTLNTICFRQPRPNESYAGWGTDMRASLDVPDGRTLQGAKFTVAIAAANVTMGEAGIDETLQYSLEAESFPTVTFTLESNEALVLPTDGGMAATTTLDGTLEMVGQRIPVSIRGDVMCLIGENNERRLRLTGIFQIRLLHPFKILGPVGEPPHNDTVFFYVRLYLKPRA